METLDSADYFPGDEHSSLLWTFLNYGRKKSYNIGPWQFLLLINITIYEHKQRSRRKKESK
jgi:hypothetical protein